MTGKRGQTFALYHYIFNKPAVQVLNLKNTNKLRSISLRIKFVLHTANSFAVS